MTKTTFAPSVPREEQKKVVIENGKIVEYRVNVKVTFVPEKE